MISTSVFPNPCYSDDRFVSNALPMCCWEQPRVPANSGQLKSMLTGVLKGQVVSWLTFLILTINLFIFRQHTVIACYSISYPFMRMRILDLHKTPQGSLSVIMVVTAQALAHQDWPWKHSQGHFWKIWCTGITKNSILLNFDCNFLQVWSSRIKIRSFALAFSQGQYPSWLWLEQ